jgi:DNA polymerase
VLGRAVTIGRVRGTVLDDTDPPVVVTTHPSAVLRPRGKDGFDAAFADLVADLRLAAPYA